MQTLDFSLLLRIFVAWEYFHVAFKLKMQCSVLFLISVDIDVTFYNYPYQYYECEMRFLESEKRHRLLFN